MFRRSILVVLGVALLLVAPALADDTQQKTVSAAPAPADEATTLPLAGKVILVDPGHGGVDTGTTQTFKSCGVAPFPGYSKVEESYINLQNARKTAEALRKLGATVYLTRDDMQSTVSLTDREDMQAGLKKPAGASSPIHPDAFISLHVNSFPKREQRRKRNFNDVEIFYWHPFANGLGLARSIEPRIRAALNQPAVIMSNDLAVVDHNPQVPKVLVEVGYLTNPQICRDLLDDKYQWLIADAVARGVADYLK